MIIPRSPPSRGRRRLVQQQLRVAQQRGGWRQPLLMLVGEPRRLCNRRPPRGIASTAATACLPKAPRHCFLEGCAIELQPGPAGGNTWGIFTGRTAGRTSGRSNWSPFCRSASQAVLSVVVAGARGIASGGCLFFAQRTGPGGLLPNPSMITRTSDHDGTGLDGRQVALSQPVELVSLPAEFVSVLSVGVVRLCSVGQDRGALRASRAGAVFSSLNERDRVVCSRTRA
jgi:hypothetical protein